MTKTYITNPPASTPIVTVVPANQTSQPWAPPAGAVTIPAWPNFPGSPAGTPVLPANFLVTQFIAGYETQGTTANQSVIDQFEATAETYSGTQRAAWEALGEPANWTPALPPAAPNLPFGPATIVMDPAVAGQGWLLPTGSGVAAGICPPFVQPARPQGVPYLMGLLGVFDFLMPNGKMQPNTAVYSLQAGKDTVTPTLGNPNPQVTLFANMPYGGLVYDGRFGVTLTLMLISGPWGKQYYASVAPVAQAS